PGETLQGHATLDRIGSEPAKGTLTISLEHGLRSRETVKTIDVNLTEKSQQFEFELRLPERELGHAIVATFVSADGASASEAHAYFSIAEHFQRVALAGSPYGQSSSTISDPEKIDAAYRQHRKSYTNWQEVFAWAEEDMVEMSPDADVWYSGQTCYRIY